MYRILKKRMLNPSVVLLEIEAPAIAKKAQPGQFIILRVNEQGERIPLTIADFDRQRGSVTVIAQTVGATTELLAAQAGRGIYCRFCRPARGAHAHRRAQKGGCRGGRRGLRHRLPGGQKAA